MFYLPRFTPDTANDRMPGPPEPLEWPLYGRCVALFGPDGIGKSTLLRHLVNEAGASAPVFLDDASPEAATALAAAHPERRIFVTTTEAGYPGFRDYQILPFDGADIHQFLHCWNEGNPFSQPVNAVVAAILAHAELSELAGNPACLAEIASAVSAGTILPAGMDQLCSRVVQAASRRR